MRPSDVAALAAFLAAADIDVLELTGPGVALRLRRGQRPAPAAPAPAPPEPARHGGTEARAAAAGLFLASHPVRDDPMAAPGDRVSAGQALGFLQVGPLLLPVAAPRDAVLRSALVPNGTPVGYGTALFDLDPFPA